jgi:putative spermidine/putrescine transport system permease protein
LGRAERSDRCEQLTMRARVVPTQWSALPSDSSRLRWRVVDSLIGIRKALTAASPARLQRSLPLVPALALVGLLVIGLLALTWRSLHSYNDYLATQGGFSLSQYSTALSDPGFHSVLMRTLVMAVITPIAAVAVGLPYALVMTRSKRRWLRLILLIAMFVPILTGDITRTYGLLVTIGPNGPLNWVTTNLGLGSPNLYGTLWAVGVGIFQTLLPVAVVILLPALLRIDPELGMAASTMGASPRAVFLRITLPQLRNAIASAIATGFALCIASFADPAILGRGLKNFVSNFLQSRYLTLGSPPQGAAIGIILLALVSLGTGLILALGRPRSGRSS